MQHRNEACLEEQLATGLQEGDESATDDLMPRMPEPLQHGGVHADNGAVELCREIAAWRVLVEILEGLLELGVRGTSLRTSHDRYARIAADNSSGSERFGIWPAASRSTSVLPEIFSCTKRPTGAGETMSLELCRIRVGFVTELKSSRLSDRNVTLAKWRAKFGSVLQKFSVNSSAQLWPIGVAHEQRSHGRRPAEVIRIQFVEQGMNIVVLESALVLPRVDVFRRRPDEYQGSETGPISDRRKNADHGTDRVPDIHGVRQFQGVHDLDNVVGIPVKGVVLCEVVRFRIGVTRPDVVEQDHFVISCEGGCDVTPHALAAAESVGKDHGATVGIAGDCDVIAA